MTRDVIDYDVIFSIRSEYFLQSILCWNRLDDFIPGSMHYFGDADTVGVLTIGNESSKPLGVGKVVVNITDNGGTTRKLELHKALYFPGSPVRIISVTKLALQFDDED